MQFGSLLRKTRKASGFSQEEVAEKLLVSRSTVSRLENDEIELKAVDLIRWFQVTQAPEITVALLVGLDVSAIQQIVSSLTQIIS
ncbi:helix-turn-helix domain-containing protein [Paenalkalicoccus suaedae]|uniref:Helix-turn-helix domain-containing protein n=1 Tax=Paenalkalicoccus suaedae TaxID=2592382 RepID=A0A859FGK5_9BACI|nr:helix-turn-helix transcriptional regulator [Paenalkalicoccus suaedae]QKS71940.1 helix-turn-helix domain-containing protein [Paenalkalicoccus suaedae]